MGIRKIKPNTPGQRFSSVLDFAEITRTPPEKSLLRPLRKTGGRNHQGRITCRHRGGGHRRHYRLIDFKRNKFDIPARVDSIEYDPNRSANIALLIYNDGEKRYILAPRGLKVGDNILSAEKGEIQVGNAMKLSNIPNGISIHNIELKPGKGGQIVRSAGVSAVIVAREGKFVTLRLPSGELRYFSQDCMATIGEVGNKDHGQVQLGKAGRKRWMGIRPTVRGVVMNPVDHPHGGGEGKSSGGRHPSTPWGKPTKGYKTRKKNHPSDRMIVRRRKK